MSVSTSPLPARRLPVPDDLSVPADPRGGAIPAESVQMVPLDATQLGQIARVTGLCVTLFVGPMGPGPVRAGNPLSEQIAMARHAALAAGYAEDVVERVLAPAVRFAAHMQAWTTSSPGMALCLGPSCARAFTLPQTVVPHVVVGEAFRLHPLVATRVFKSTSQTLRGWVGRPMTTVVTSSSVMTNPADIDEAAREGRITTLFVGVAMPVHTRDRAEEPSVADRAITATLRAGGRVRFVPVGMGPYTLAATLA